MEPATGPQSAAALVRETHSAVVLLCGDLAYKVKKPVDLGFLDFRTLDARRRMTYRELDLNRRLSPDVYLGVDTLLDADGAAREYVLVMRRMPEEARLSALLRRGVPVESCLRALARLVAAFHAQARRGPEVSAEGSAEALRRRWTANLRETERYVGPILDAAQHDALSQLVRRYLDGREALLRSRMDEGCIVDGHGDLISDDVFCLPDHPRVLDCLDFDDRLRYVDVLDDVSFLAMDIEHLGHPDLARLFLDAYVEYAGTPPRPSLAHHYVSYRAFVRAKVTCIRAAQGEESAAAQARALTDLAVAHAREAEVRLVVVCGAPATGKSTLAGGLADAVGAVLLSSDAVRRELPEAGPARYTKAAKDAAYATLLARAELSLTHGETVVLDATFGDPATQELASDLAERTSSTLAVLECRLDPELAAVRAQRRLGAGADLSEAGAEVALALAREAVPWPGAAVLDTTAAPGDVLETALRRLGRSPDAPA
ncbi:MAG TPA: AAA family ATPase [Actinomycetes bacterium]|nr:AAA family ATPase [Actinomycetes bacterium]